MSQPVFIESSVLVFATGAPHRHREPARSLLQAGMRGDLLLHASVEAVQEFIFHRMRIGAADPVGEARSLRRGLVLLSFSVDVLDHAMTLIEDSAIRGRDAVHAATALGAGFDQLASADSDFDKVPGLRRIPPEEWSLVGSR